MKERICNCGKPVINVHFGLCIECNNVRLHGSKFGKQYNSVESTRKPITPLKNRKKNKAKRSLFTTVKVGGRLAGKNLRLDEAFYEECFNNSDHKCEECSKELPTEFRDADGKIIARWRYSHIIPKSIASSLRHVIKNINHLCVTCHTRWENGDKENMKIYDDNSKRFPNYF